MDSEKNYYKILDLPKTATLSEIKDSYKKLALKWHPDKNRHNPEESKRKFQKISEAYSILSDPEKRKKYDKYGTVEDFDFDFDQFMKEFDFSDMFDMMFMGMNGFMGGMGRKGHRNMRHFHCDFEKHMKDFKRKKDKMRKNEEEYEKHGEHEWETEEELQENDDDFEDLSGNEEEEVEEESNNKKNSKKTDKYKKNTQDKMPINFSIDKIFDNINDKHNNDKKKKKHKKPGKDEIQMIFLPMFVAENSLELKKNRFKCKFDGEILQESQLFRHFEKEHNDELYKFIEDNDDLENMNMGDFGGIDFLEDINEMFMGGKKKKGSKFF